MDDNLYQDDFEEFLQDQVRNQRMYPSDAVWRNINKELHGDNRWPALSVSAFALLIATVAVCIHFSPKPNIFAIPATLNQKRNAGSASQIADLSSPSFLKRSNNITTAFPGNRLRSVSGNSTLPNTLSKLKTDLANDSKVKYLVSSISEKVETGSIAKVISIDKVTQPTSSSPSKQTSEELNSNTIVTDPVIQSGSTSKNISPIASQSVPDFNDKNVVDDFLKEHKNDLSLYTATQSKSIKNRFSYVIYFAPSVSYRKLKEDHSGLKDNAAGTGGPVALNYVTDVNKVVRHKPGTGIEAGFGLIYNLSNKLRIRSGLQFNIRQYNIEAYRSSGEQASIALVTANSIDTLNTYSVYRTNNGYVSAELVNRYYQLAIPLGVEWEIIGSKKIQLNVAGSIQPTYLLNKNAYLLSTNYKNYTESRGMINSFNLNSNIEAFISFKVRDYKWQLGPQLRYQHFSTFISPYPIKEHLIDYGIKLGVSKIIL